MIEKILHNIERKKKFPSSKQCDGVPIYNIRDTSCQENALIKRGVKALSTSHNHIFLCKVLNSLTKIFSRSLNFNLHLIAGIFPKSRFYYSNTHS